MVPAISVIVTAHFRKAFILDAINSALNQTLEKDLYEILVVKNFEDKTIDNFIQERNIENIYLEEEPIGPKYVKGIKRSSGEIVCILEDDDRFKSNKLEKVYSKFKNKSLGFYHNNFEIINENGNVTRSKFYDNYHGSPLYIENNKKERYYKKIVNYNSIFTNNSSICFRREIIERNLYSLNRMRNSSDYFLMMLAMDSNLDVLFDNEILTQYRIHHENTSIIKKPDFDQYLINLAQLYRKYVEDNNVLIDSLNKKYLIETVKFRMLLFKIEICAIKKLLGEKQEGNKMVNYNDILFFAKKSIEMRYKHAFLSLLLYLAPLHVKRLIMEASYRRSLER